MQITFLGTGSQYPSKDRGVSCTALRLDNGDVWLFDCGEGSQIQLQKSSVKAARISKIFITHLHGDHLFGLPGLLCSIGSWNPDRKDVIEIYGPVGLKKYVQTSLLLSYSLFEQLRFSIHELSISDENQKDEWKDWTKQLDESPNVQHPSEFNGHDIRPDETGIYNCCVCDGVSVKAAFIKHRVPCFGYVIEESPSPGRLNTEKLASLGLSPGPQYDQLKLGKCVSTADGKTIDPKEVTGPPIPGRKVTILGDTCDSSSLLNVAQCSDVLVHEATLQNSLRDKAVGNGHSTPEMAATFAKLINAKTLILTHFSQRYVRARERTDQLNQEMESVEMLLEEAKLSACNELTMILAEDLMEYKVSKRIPLVD